jgi:hypothetical protein
LPTGHKSHPITQTFKHQIKLKIEADLVNCYYPTGPTHLPLKSVTGGAKLMKFKGEGHNKLLPISSPRSCKGTLNFTKSHIPTPVLNYNVEGLANTVLPSDGRYAN